MNLFYPKRRNVCLCRVSRKGYETLGKVTPTKPVVIVKRQETLSVVSNDKAIILNWEPQYGRLPKDGAYRVFYIPGTLNTLWIPVKAEG